jgi:hypothetical protein
MRYGTLPAGLRARRQRSGTIYFYFSSGPGIKEVPLGSNQTSAFVQYQVLQRRRLMDMRPHGITMLDLLTQFQLCEPPPAERHARLRRDKELTQLHTYFSECGNPTVRESPDLQNYLSWLAGRAPPRNLDSVRLFRRIWNFMQRHNYLDSPCPWASPPSHRERIALEIVDILSLYAPPRLKQLLGQILDPASTLGIPQSDPTLASVESSGEDIENGLTAALEHARRDASEALMNSHRDDLLGPLAALTIDELLALQSSPTRANHLPPGKIDLSIGRKTVIARLRARTS